MVFEQLYKKQSQAFFKTKSANCIAFEEVDCLRKAKNKLKT